MSGKTVSSERACRVAGITYRQLDYWTRTGIATPAVASFGCGTPRGWSPEDLGRLVVLGRLSEILERTRFREAARAVWSDTGSRWLLLREGRFVATSDTEQAWDAPLRIDLAALRRSAA